MNLTKEIATHFRQVYFGGNWTSVNFKDTLAGVSWQQATTKVYTFNTIATLVYHTNYYVSAVTKVLLGEPLDAKDIYSFDHPAIESEAGWQNLLTKMWADAEHFATLIELLPGEQLVENFTAEKYGSYYRNIHGIVEHNHYHLGQIVLLKKILLQPGEIVSVS